MVAWYGIQRRITPAHSLRLWDTLRAEDMAMERTYIDVGAAKPLLLVLSGPSGSGKSSLITCFRQAESDFVESVSATTRDPRPGEAEGEDYFFLSETDFVDRIQAGGFLEHAQVFGRHRYGTPKAFVDEQNAAGKSVIMDIDIQGGRQVRANREDAILVFIGVPSWEELERRLRGRGTESDEDVGRRLAEAAIEAAHWRDYDYVIINDDLQTACTELRAIIAAERARVARR
jgi:guanylate kinase